MRQVGCAHLSGAEHADRRHRNYRRN
jgi:hypothetical protein